MIELKQLLKDWGLPSILIVALVALWLGLTVSPVLGDLKQHIAEASRQARLLHQICKNTSVDKADRQECDNLWTVP